MQFDFIKYLRGDKLAPWADVQEAEGVFECEVCFKSVHKAYVTDNTVFWKCPEGHENQAKR